MQIITAVVRGIIVYCGLTINGLLGLILVKGTFGIGQNFFNEIIAPNISRLILLLIGIWVKTPSKADFPEGRVIYMFNHNSYLDLMLVPLLGLSKTRFIISATTKKVLPLLW